MVDTSDTQDRCVHVNRRTGLRCNRVPILGGTVCIMHGGNAAHVKRAAAERLVLALPEAVDQLVARLRDDTGTPCPVCGRGMRRDDNTIIKVALAIMDRAGLGPQSKIEIERSDATNWMHYLTDEEFNQIEEIIRIALERANSEEDSE